MSLAQAVPRRRPPEPEPDYACPKCEDRGWLPGGRPLTVRPCSCRDQVDIPALLRCVPPRYLDTSARLGKMPIPLGEWPRDELAEAGKTSVYLWGVNGDGKSTLAAAILRRAVGLFGVRRVAWVTPAQLQLEHQRLALGVPRPLYDQAMSAEVTVIDELGMHQLDRTGETFLTALVEERYGGKRWTVCTSHLAQADMAQAMGAIWSRLQEGLVFELPDVDHRTTGLDNGVAVS